MTFFQIADEYERDFEPLEQDDFEGCAYASLLYVQMGHMCARQMTDGRMTPAMLKKRLSLWPEARRELAVAHLLEMGKWRQTETGYEFVDWDLTQYTREQESRRRALAAERQRQRRRRLAEAALPDEVSGVHRIPQPSAASRVTGVTEPASRVTGVTEPASRVTGVTEPGEPSPASRETPQDPNTQSLEKSEMSRVTAPATEPALHLVSRSDAQEPTEAQTKPLENPAMSRVTSRSPLPLPLSLSDQETSSPGNAAPSAPRPERADLVKAKEKRTRARGPLDEARETLVAMFTAEYAPRHEGARSLLAQPLLTQLARCYQRPDGTLNSDLVARALRGFFADRFWYTKGGHSFTTFARHHERYDMQPHQETQGYVDYGY